MESLNVQESVKNSVHDTGSLENESSEKFQNFIYELFDNNGVLNDLRAYLRGHIVQILNSAQSGEPPLCQKRFVQRLDLTMQAVNAVVAEYLLREEFQYSLSVFLSELPLTNMVFEFTKSLRNYKNCTKKDGLKFTERDIHSIFNILGIKCNSTDMDQIIKMYGNSECPPLLLCIMKCIPLHRPPSIIQVKESATTDKHKKSTEIQISKFLLGKCWHRSSCKNCQARYQKLREKYSRKNKELKLAVVRLKASYDYEIELVRNNERAKSEDVLKVQAEQLEEEVKELKRRYAERENALERDAEQTRRFVRGLARRLRARLATVLNAATALRDERRRLNVKEENLKRELTLAEEILSSQGEELKSEICNELAALEGHLDAMKRERDIINKERAELEHMKQESKNQKNEEALRMNCELLKEELAALREHLKTIQSATRTKEMVNREVLTEECGISNAVSFQSSGHGYNNVTQSCSDLKNCEKNNFYNDIISHPPKKVINDFRKEKIVNITTDAQVQASVEDPRLSVWPTISRELVAQLSEKLYSEGLQFKMLAMQQGTHLEYLTAQQAKLRSELESRCNSAPGPRPARRSQTKTGTVGDRQDVETELCAPKPAARSRSATVERCRPLDISATVDAQPSKRVHHSSLEREQPSNNIVLSEEQKQTVVATSEHRNGKIGGQSTAERKPSQDSVLREAIMKLKKLEIEAEAVENAYLDTRRRHSKLVTSLQLDGCQQTLQTSQKPLLNVSDTTKSHPSKRTMKSVSYFEDTENLIRLHQKTNHNVREYPMDLKKRDVSEKRKTKISYFTKKPCPIIPESRTKIERVCNKNLLETPLLEFRKYYHMDGSLQYMYTPDSSETQTNTDILPLLKDTATSPITLSDTETVSKTAATKGDTKMLEKEQNDIEFRDNPKKKYVNNKNKDEVVLISEGDHRTENDGEDRKDDSSEKLEKLNLPGSLEIVDRECIGEVEIRQIDLINKNNSSSASSERESQKRQRRMRGTSLEENSIEKAESEPVEFEIVDTSTKDHRSIGSIDNIDIDGKIEKSVSDRQIASEKSQNLKFDVADPPFGSGADDKDRHSDKVNAKSDFENDSTNDSIDVNRSGSSISLEKISSVEDNFWHY